MNTKAILNGELIYQADIRFTGMVDYGISMEDFSTGKTPIPAEGMRFDQTFSGELLGPKLTGRITGTDYFYIRADGLFQLHLHAHVRTKDNMNISFTSTGVSIHKEGEQIAQLRATVSLFSSFDSYKWVNHLSLWALGTLNPVKNSAIISAYAV